MENAMMDRERPCFWAILPEALAPGQPWEREAPALALHGGIAVLPVRGVLDKERMRALAGLLQDAAEDPAARAILLDVDSPGGTVDGTEEFALAVRGAGAAKPVYAYADGMMCSAAYWAASQAREIAAPETAQVGSIGVIAVHREYSAAMQEAGITVNVLAAGRYKAAGNPWEPLDEEMRAYLQQGIDEAYGVFLKSVALGRKTTVEKASLMAEGRVYGGSGAREAGLVDRVETRAEFLEHIKRSITMEEKAMAEAQALQPEAAKPEAAPAAAAAVENAVAEAAAQPEKDDAQRIFGLARAVFGEEAGGKFCALAQSGMTADQYAAAISAAGAVAGSEARLAELREARSAGGISPLAEQSAPDFEALVQQGVKQGKGRAQAVREAVGSAPAAYQAWLAKIRNDA